MRRNFYVTLIVILATSTCVLAQLSDEQVINQALEGYLSGRISPEQVPATALPKPIEISVANHSYQAYACGFFTPLVFDMDGDKKLQASNGVWLPHPLKTKKENLVEFDINGDQFDELIEWVGPEDGLLITYDKKTKGHVNGNHLFGRAGGFSSGFEKLWPWDKDKDYKITDKELEGLSIWQDKNSNARVEAGEIKSVQDLGITTIFLSNNRLQVSRCIKDGKKMLIWDWSPVMIMVKKRKR